MKIIKRIFIGITALLVLIVGLAILGPMLFKDQIVSNVKTSVNKMLDAEVDFTDVNVSFLRSFPSIQVSVEEFSVIGVDTFAGYPLAKGTYAAVDLDFWSVISGSKTGDYTIEAIELVDPEIKLLVLSEALANYDIVASSSTTTEEETTSSGGMQLALEEYQIENGSFLYDDRVGGIYLEIEGLDHNGKGDFTLEVFDLDTESSFNSITFKQGGIAYLDDVEGALDAVLNIDLFNSRYAFKENNLRLNALNLAFDGSIAMPTDDIFFELTFSAPANDFREVWSMIPSTYIAGYQDVKSAGTFTLNGAVNGPFNSENAVYPSFSVDLGIDNGSVQYPGSPVGVNQIFADVSINSPTATLDEMTVDIPRFQLNLGGDPFGGNFKLSRPISDPTVDARLEGKLDLTKWASAIPMTGISELAGLIIADVSIQNAKQSLLEAGNYAAVNIAGQLGIEDLIYAADGLPAINISQATADFTPERVNVPNMQMQLGSSDLSGSASINNLLAYFSPQKTMTGSVQVTSNVFNADEWVSGETDAATGASPAEITAAEQATAPAEVQTELFNRFDFTVDAAVNEINYGAYKLEDNRVVGRIQPNNLLISEMTTTMGNTSLSGNGTVTNAWDYYFKDAVLGGQLNLSSNFVDIGDFMSETSVSEPSGGEAAESMEAVPVPGDINLAVNLTADQVKYTNIMLDNVQGDLVIRDQQVVIENGKTNAFGGLIDFAGAYDTSEPGEPGFRFHYNLSALDFRPAFKQLNTFQSLAPVGQFLQGQFSSDLVIDGKLGDGLYPIMNTINAQGFIQTQDASLANFSPLQKVGQALNVSSLREAINLKGLKSWFRIENGKVSVEPFNITIAGIPMKIAGEHGIDMDMDYQISAAVPRELIEGNIVTGAAINALDRLAGQAQNLGLDIQPGDTLNMGINLTGSIASPQTKVNLIGTNQGNGQSPGGAISDALGEQVANQVDEVKDEAETRLNEARDEAAARADSIRNAVANQANTVVDSVRNTIVDEANNVRDQAVNRLGDLVTGQGTAPQDSSRINLPTGAVDSTVQDIRNEINRFNPFKRKKKKPDGDE